MHSFRDVDQMVGSVPFDVVRTLRAVDTGRGSEALYRDKLPALLTELAHRARVSSITASSAIEGVIVPDQARAAGIISGRVASGLRTRSEQELAGYRAAVDYLLNEDWRPLNVGLILHLHRLLFAETNTAGGLLKTDDNLVVDRLPDGRLVERFRPVSAHEVGPAMAELLSAFDAARLADRHHPIILVGLFVLDLLTIHPFADGNGRVARALTNALLEDAGYGVTRYVSIEQSIADQADGYYESLLASTRGWHESAHDPWPWLRFFTGLLSGAYADLAVRTATDRATGSKKDRVRQYVLDGEREIFAIRDVRAALPGISDQTIRLVLEELKRSGRVAPDGVGRSAVWRRYAPADRLGPAASSQAGRAGEAGSNGVERGGDGLSDV